MIASNVLPADWRSAFDPRHRRIGVGIDPATTTKKLSNPTAIAVVQQVGLMYFCRLALRFKTSDPRVTSYLLREIVTGLPSGLKARRISILSTNERFYAATVKRELSGICPVEPVIESEATEYLGQKMTYKQYLGNQLINTADDGYLAVPNEQWVKFDLRQTVRDKGTFLAEPDEAGNHADLFCAIGAALHALIRRGGPVEASAAAVGSMSGKPDQGWKNPYAGKINEGVKVHA